MTQSDTGNDGSVERGVEELRTLALTDALTGIANRRAFDDRLEYEWKRGARARQPLALVMVDVDHFKLYNDAYGHVAGDGCLQQIANALAGTVRRSTDCATRYGGEEFAVILPDTDDAAATILAEAMRAAVASLGLEHRGSTHGNTTISCGVAALVPDESQDRFALVRAADAALYEAKTGGRNRVERHPGVDPSGKPLADAPHNLPVVRRRLVGRASASARLRELIAGGAAVVTLAGPPGIGKTRLALEVAYDLRGRFSGGVWFVDLALLANDASPEEIAESVAGSMMLAARPGTTTMSAVGEALLSRPTLLLFDNAEHIRDATRDLILQLRDAAPLHALVTSRAALRLDGEIVEQVAPLDVPPENVTDDAETRRFAAVELFTARAHDALPAVRPPDDLARVAARVVRELDGVPLAIELAAARLSVLTPAELSARLDDRLRLLRGRDARGRHQTLEALHDWSYALLSPTEQRAFARLAIFTGGWTLAAAEAVCFEAGADPFDAIEAMAALVDASLAFVEYDDATTKRFRFLETTRAYAAHKLEESGEREAIAARQAAYVLAVARDHRDRIASAAPIPWLAGQARDAENIRAAVRWAFASRERRELAADLCIALAFFWSRRFFELPDAIAWTERALAEYDAASDGDPQRGADLLHALAQLRSLTGEPARVEALARRALAAYRSLGDRVGTARSLVLAAHGVIGADPDGAELLLREAADLARENNELRALGVAGRGLARVAAARNDWERAESILAETAEVYRRLDDPVGRALVLGSLAYNAHCRGDDGGAVDRIRQALATIEVTRSDYEDGWLLTNAASFESIAGSRDDALRHARRAIELLRTGGNDSLVRSCLLTIGGIVLDEGDAQRGTTLLAYANAGEQHSLSPAVSEREWFDRHLSAGRSALGERFDACWSAGTAMTASAALELAAAGMEEATRPA